MPDSAITQEAEIANREALKLITNKDSTIEELGRLRKNIDQKRKDINRPHRISIKETDELFAGPIKLLKVAAQKLKVNKPEAETK